MFLGKENIGEIFASLAPDTKLQLFLPILSSWRTKLMDGSLLHFVQTYRKILI